MGFSLVKAMVSLFILVNIVHIFLFTSNIFQAQKAKDKEENEHLLEDLDKNFTSLVQSEALLSLTEPNKMSSLKALVNRSIPNEPSNKDSLSGTRRIDKSAEVCFLQESIPYC